MATTSLAVRDAMATVIRAITPRNSPEYKFQQVQSMDVLSNYPVDRSIMRKFEIESGGMIIDETMIRGNLTRDIVKKFVVRVAYNVSDNNDTVRDAADADEFDIARALCLPGNISTIGAMDITFKGSDHIIEQHRRMIEMTFECMFNHSA